MALMVAGYIPFMVLEEAGGMIIMLIATSAAGTGMGMTNVTALVAAQGAVPFKNLGVATSTIMLFRTIGGALILSIMGSILLQRMNATFTVIAADLKASVPESVLAKAPEPAEPARARHPRADTRRPHADPHRRPRQRAVVGLSWWGWPPRWRGLC